MTPTRRTVTVRLPSYDQTVVIRHGTTNCYQNLGCRCQPCKTSWAQYVRDRRAIARAQEPARAVLHDCETCVDCIHDGHKCCGCYDGACCRRADPPLTGA